MILLVKIHAVSFPHSIKALLGTRASSSPRLASPTIIVSHKTSLLSPFDDEQYTSDRNLAHYIRCMQRREIKVGGVWARDLFRELARAEPQ